VGGLLTRSPAEPSPLPAPNVLPGQSSNTPAVSPIAYFHGIVKRLSLAGARAATYIFRLASVPKVLARRPSKRTLFWVGVAVLALVPTLFMDFPSLTRNRNTKEPAELRGQTDIAQADVKGEVTSGRGTITSSQTRPKSAVARKEIKKETLIPSGGGDFSSNTPTQSSDPPKVGVAQAKTPPGLGSVQSITLDGSVNSVVELVTSEGKIKIELFSDEAPITVKNFLKYVDDKHYDGTIFHRVISNFMIQGGGFEPGLKEKQTRDPIKNESANGVANKRGTLAMARTNVPDSATSQFFINVKDNAFLDKANAGDGVGYAVFGQVTDGIDIVDRIRKVETGSQGGHRDVPVKDVVIRSVRRAGSVRRANRAFARERKDTKDRLPDVSGYDFSPGPDETVMVKAEKKGTGHKYYQAVFTGKSGDSRKYLIETFPTGKPFSIEVFQNSVPLESKAWWSNGKRSLSASFRSFMPSGTWEFWNSDGQTIGKIDFGIGRPRLLVWEKGQMATFARINNFYFDIVSAAAEALRD